MTDKFQAPYLYVKQVVLLSKYNKNYGDDRLCECGHTYYRHFDSYEDMEACGCKYCQCYTFVEQGSPQSSDEDKLISSKTINRVGWIECKTGILPDDLEVVICQYSGHWPGRGNGGIVDLYCTAGKWWNHPDTVTIEKWMYDPDNVTIEMSSY